MCEVNKLVWATFVGGKVMCAVSALCSGLTFTKKWGLN